MAFNLDDYQTVAERFSLFKEVYPEGCIIPMVIDSERASEEVLYVAMLFTDHKSYEEGCDRFVKYWTDGGAEPHDPLFVESLLVSLFKPHSIGHAYEAKWMQGASKTSWIENGETSVAGRALVWAGFGQGATREEMEKVERATEAAEKPVQTAEEPKASKPTPTGVKVASDAQMGKLKYEMGTACELLGIKDEDTKITLLQKLMVERFDSQYYKLTSPVASKIIGFLIDEQKDLLEWIKVKMETPEDPQEKIL